jgi:hypothetical protein
MTRRLLAISLTITAILAPGLTRAQDSAPRNAAYTLRPEWTIETARSGRARVVGYLYNTSGTMDAANVLLRVDQLTPNGEVSHTQRSLVFGDVLARGRLSFEVPIPTPTPTVRVVVESVDWVHECR